jgi:2-hydroxy-3-keto-5-methylthiopentenyl-1-phosphate phosphatase
LHTLVDFDGTIVPGDATDALFDRFADARWRDIESAWQAGRISSRECMGRQVELLRATPRELDAAIRTVEIDPEFPKFLRFCRRHDIDVTVVSDGFDRVVHSVLERARLPIRFFANKLVWLGGDRWRLEFPFARRDCRSDSANCKCSHRLSKERPCVVVGDGRSDFCMSIQADHVISKGALTHFCRSNRLSHTSFETFDDVTYHLGRWLSYRRASGGGSQSAVEAAIQRELFAQQGANE